MFTGIIEEVGQIVSVKRGQVSSRLKVKGSKIFEDIHLGDSIAVNGVCLTATTIDGDTFEADVMAETMNWSSLGLLQPGSRVNLERAMPADGRFGGHIVAGHVDGTGTIVKIEKDETAVWYRIEAAPEVLRYIVEKGSITIDGISLTVATVSDTDFQVSIIPHTQANTVLSDRKTGDVVNLETDIIGKYVEKLLQPQKIPEKESKITLEFLAENGF